VKADVLEGGEHIDGKSDDTQLSKVDHAFPDFIPVFAEESFGGRGIKECHASHGHVFVGPHIEDDQSNVPKVENVLTETLGL